MEDYIVELEEGLWIAPWDGGQGRTAKKVNAKNFTKQSTAWRAIESAQRLRPFKNAKVCGAKTDRPREYQKYEFCQATACPNFNDGACDHKGRSLVVCSRTAKEFHGWLTEKGFEIVRRDG